MKIDFVSDIACPWCAVGLSSLERALQNLGADIPVELHFQPFELHPTMPPEGADAAAFLRAKYGMNAAQLAESRRVLHERGAAVGFVFGERAHVSIFVSSGDRALALSSRIAGERPRVGALDPSNPRDRADLTRLGVRVYDLSSFSDGFIGHGAYADAPAVIRTIGAQLAAPAAGDGDKAAVLDAGVERAPVQAGVVPMPSATLGPLTQPSSQLAPRAMVSQPAPQPVIEAPAMPGAVTSEPLPPMGQ